MQIQNFRLEIEAPGLDPFFSETLRTTQPNFNFAVVLHKSATHAPVTVLLPDGKPAAGVSLYVDLKEPENGWAPDFSINIFGSGRPMISARQKKTVVADGSGHVMLPAAPEEALVLVLHEDGCLFTTIGQLRQSPEVRLKPWGRLEGTVKLNGHPKAAQRVEARLADPILMKHVFLDVSANSDRDGHFVFPKLPPAKFTVHCTAVSQGSWPQNHFTSITIAPGQAAHLDYLIAGRPVTGQIRLVPAGAAVDWKENLSDFLFSAQRPPRHDQTEEGPVYEDYVETSDYEAAFQKHDSTPSLDSGPETYAPQIDASGGFRAEAIASGTYELSVILVSGPTEREETVGGIKRKFQIPASMRQSVGSLKRSVVIPPAPVDKPDESFDLGVIDLSVDTASLPKQPMPSFSARALDGHNVNLADYRGKNVLIIFWASWAMSQNDLFAQWKSIATAYGTDPRLVLLGVSLDDDAAAAEKFARANGLPGLQTRLEGAARAAVTEQLSIDQLPAAMLVGPDGHLVTGQLLPPNLRAAINGALAK